jgi:hypothetical protein
MRSGRVVESYKQEVKVIILQLRWSNLYRKIVFFADFVTKLLFVISKTLIKRELFCGDFELAIILIWICNYSRCDGYVEAVSSCHSIKWDGLSL